MIDIFSYGQFSSEDQSRWIFDHLKLSRGQKVLDLGAGSGNFWIKHQKDLPSDLSVTLIDRNKSLLDKAKQLLCRDNRFNYVHSNIESFSPLEKYDLVYAGSVLPFLDFDQRIALYKMVAQSLTPSGLFVADLGTNRTLLELRSDPVKNILREAGLSNPLFKIARRLSFEDALEEVTDIFQKGEESYFENELLILQSSAIVDYHLKFVKGLSSKKIEELTSYYESLRDKETSLIKVDASWGLFAFRAP